MTHKRSLVRVQYGPLLMFGASSLLRRSLRQFYGWVRAVPGEAHTSPTPLVAAREHDSLACQIGRFPSSRHRPLRPGGGRAAEVPTRPREGERSAHRLDVLGVARRACGRHRHVGGRRLCERGLRWRAGRVYPAAGVSAPSTGGMESAASSCVVCSGVSTFTWSISSATRRFSPSASASG